MDGPVRVPPGGGIVTGMPLDPVAAARRYGADEARAAAAELSAGAVQLDAVRARLAATLAAVRWRSAAADAGLLEAEKLAAILREAARSCGAAADLLRARSAEAGP